MLIAVVCVIACKNYSSNKVQVYLKSVTYCPVSQKVIVRLFSAEYFTKQEYFDFNESPVSFLRLKNFKEVIVTNKNALADSNHSRPFNGSFSNIV